MSRYKKVITGELELPEIDGTKYLIFPTIETRMELLEHIKSTQIIEEVDAKDNFGKVVSTTRIKGKHLDLPSISRTCAKIIYEGCFEHDEKGKRTVKKEDEKETTEEQILSLILQSDIMAVYLEICIALGIIEKDKAQKLREGQAEEAKKQ
jgi:hypothetical protein